MCHIGRDLFTSHPLLQATYTGVRITVLGNIFFPSFLAKTKRKQPLPGHIHCKFWPCSLRFWLWFLVQKSSVCCCSPCGRERLKSDSRVASDHQNLHRLHRHNIGLKLCFETGFVPGSTCDRGKSKMEKKTNTQIQRQIHCTVHCAAGWPGSGYSQTGPVVKLKQSSLRFQMNGSDAALVEIQTLSGY